MATVLKLVGQYKNFFKLVRTSFLMALIIFCLAPFFIPDQVFPADIYYPFLTEHLAIKCTIYVLHVIAATQIALSGFMDLMIAYIFWIETVQLELLGYKIKYSNNKTDINACIKKHQHLIQ